MGRTYRAEPEQRLWEHAQVRATKQHGGSPAALRKRVARERRQQEQLRRSAA